MACKRHLTEVQHDVLSFIKRYIADNGFPPTIREICSWFGWSSTNAAYEILERLERRGWVTLAVGKARGIRVLP